LPAKLTRKKADELAAANKTPLDVMIDNMNFWRERAAELTDIMQKKLNELAAMPITNEDERKIFVKEMRDFNKIAAHMIAARDKSQSCAVDAAPYVHPKLTSISMKPNSPSVRIQMALAVAVTQALDDDGNPKPKQLNGRAA
jgi:hypothetical protein